MVPEFPMRPTADATSGRSWMACSSSSETGGFLRSGQGSSGLLHWLFVGSRRLIWKVVAPNSSRSFWKLWRMPCTAAAIVTTTNTPTATPEIVSAARTLLLRIASKAMVTPSSAMAIRAKNFIGPSSFLPQRGDRIEAGGPRGGVYAGHDPHTGAEQQRHGDRPGRDRRGKRREPGDDLRREQAQRDADAGADHAQRGRLDQELREDVDAARAKRLPDADLPRALRDRHEHDVHDDHGADDEPDGGQGGAEDDHLPLEPVEEGECRVLGFERKVVGPSRRQVPRAAHHLARALDAVLHFVPRTALHDHRLQVALGLDEAAHRRGPWHDGHPVEREAEHASLFLQHADHGVWRAADAHHAPERVEPVEEVVGDVGADHDHLRAGADLLRAERASALDLQLLDIEVSSLGRDGLHLARSLHLRCSVQEVLVDDVGPAA